eukprot:scaffold3479_cov106-Cylindrotheca_fusiformis.AAC.3
MFANRAPTLSSTLPSSQGLHLISNENAVVSSSKPSSVTTSTPAKSGTGMKRRAFGDISNKKQAPLSSSKSGSTNNSAAVVKKSAFTPRSKLQQYQHQSLIPKSNATRKPSNFAPKSSSKSTQQAFVPRKTSTTTSSIFQTTEPTMGKKVLFETVDDVELPAGRPFSQQDLDDYDDDDDDLSAILNAQTVTTMWDDWRESVHQQYLDEGLRIDEEVTLQVQEHMKNVFQQEEEELNGIDSLLDWVDDLDLDDDLSNTRNDVSDDWSQPASSILLDPLDDSTLFEC